MKRTFEREVVGAAGFESAPPLCNRDAILTADRQNGVIAGQTGGAILHPTLPELAAYIAANYGTCTAEPCACRKQGWRDGACSSWVPVQATTWDELREEGRGQRFPVEAEVVP